MRVQRRAGMLMAAAGVAMAVGSLGFGGVASATKKDDSGDHKVTICHRTNSVTNPYVVETVDVASVDGSERDGHPSDHSHHNGPAMSETGHYPAPHNGDQWGDIIPPFYASHAAGTWTPKNWPAGQAIFEHGCNLSQPPTESSDHPTEPSGPPTSCTDPKVPPSSSTDPSVPPSSSTDPKVPPSSSTDPKVPPSSSTDPSIPPSVPPSSTDPSVPPSSVDPSSSVVVDPPVTTTTVKVKSLPPVPTDGEIDVASGNLPSTGTSQSFFLLIGLGMVLLGLLFVAFTRRPEES